MANKEDGGQEFAKQAQAVVDAAGNVFATQDIDIPERPKDLLAELKDAQAAAQVDKYGGATVWVCDEGPGTCGAVYDQPGHTQRCHCGAHGSDCCGWYISHEYLLSELEEGTAKMFGYDPRRTFRQAEEQGLVPPVNSEWQKWHGG